MLDQYLRFLFCFYFTEIPAIPRNLNVTASSRGNVSITATWMHPQNFDQFDIDRYDISVNSTFAVQNMTTSCGQCTSISVTVSESVANSQRGTTFTGTITATNQCGETGPIATISRSKSSSPNFVSSCYLVNCILC